MDALIPVNSLSRHIAPLQDKLSQIAGDIIASGYYVLGPNVKARRPPALSSGLV
ncbi:hypothetical protein VDQ66_16770 [Xanthomonas campestris pv. campestris]|nr:hypothetical protein [Xanthomonas campestris pv. campestris]